MSDRTNAFLAGRACRAVVALAFAAAAALVYANSFSVPLVLDDVTTIANNPSIRSLWPLAGVLFPPPDVYSAGRPLLNLSYALNYAVGGTAVGGYHAVNLAIHVLAGLTLGGLARRTLELPVFSPRIRANAAVLGVVIGFLWLVHPIQTVSVTYLSQRAESLMGLFYLLTLYAFVRAVTGDRRWIAIAVLAGVAGMATKEVMVTAPVLALLYDAQFVSGSLREAWRRHRSLHLALAATWLVLAALMITSQLAARGIGSGHNLGRLDYLRIECVALLRYLQLSVWPHPLVFDYGPQVPVPTPLQLVVPLAVLGTIGCGSLILFRRSCAAGFTGLAFFILLAPSSSIVPVAGQPIAENRVYLPLAAIIATLVVAVHATLTRGKAVLAAAAGLALGAAAHARNEACAEPLRLWQDTVAKRPGNIRAWSFLSFSQAAAGRPHDAIATLQRAVRQVPGNAELHNNLGIFLFQAGRAAEAAAHLRTAVQLKPDYVAALNSLGRVLLETGDFAAAADTYGALLTREPRNAEAHNFRGVALVRLGELGVAAQHFEAALALRPEFPEARQNLDMVRAALAARARGK